jgi:ribosomal protein L11
VSGGPEPLYVLARRVLLDALEALGDHRTAIVLVGAQAIYLHVGEADLAVAPFTMDGDLAVVPVKLEPAPRLGEALERAGFLQTKEVGTWAKEASLGDVTANVPVDLLVPESLADRKGRRGARLGPHGDRAARKVKGLEAAIVDHTVMQIVSLEERDRRSFEMSVAGPTALLVAKLHKLADRAETVRASDKDALDVLRLLRAISTTTLSTRLGVLLHHNLAGAVSRGALEHLKNLFAHRSALGAQMAARALHPLEDPATIAASCEALARDLIDATSTAG